MPFDKEQWISEVLEGLPSEKQAQMRTQLDGIFAEEALAKKIGDSVLRQSDYSREMDALKAERAEALSKVEQELADKNRRLDEWYKDASGKYEAQVKAAEEAQAERDRIEAAFQKASEEADFDPATYLEGGKPKVHPGARRTETAPAVDEELKKEVAALRQQMSTLARASTRWPVEISKLVSQHREVFGTDLTAQEQDALVQEHFKHKGVKSLDELWYERHEVEKALADQQEQKVQRRLDKAREEERNKVLAEMSRQPGSNEAPMPVSPVLKTAYARQIEDSQLPAMHRRDKDGMTPVERASLKFTQRRREGHSAA